ncbi:malate synthase A [uncultured Hyphomonas sp.]|uniref:malate synthase A n=1 Tax=uncultured Hyphomonas sp. TaxID=225298 RepID=UPI002AAA6B16|nr:malate synthase A [uncultured Hyphomonas sp.]
MTIAAALEKAPLEAGHVEIRKQVEGIDRVLTEGALEFLVRLERRFGAKRRELLTARQARQARFDAGELPDFLPETKTVRDRAWEVDPIPAVLRDRRVEITGPVDRKMMINALNSGAKMFMADFEDASSPTFANMIDGQVNMQDYARNQLAYTDAKSGKSYALGEETAVMIVRPRGWHMEEAHLLVDGQPISASLFDFGLHIFHNGEKLHEAGLGPFYYLPKMESHLEARLWDEVFEFAQKALGIPVGSIKVTVLIETLPAAFEMDEILYELRRHAAGLNCGRWDYIFSYIKTLRNQASFVLPDRAQVGMDRAFLNAYSLLLIKTCHNRRAHAMGGMAAQIPVKNDEAANAAAFDKVRADKLREVKAGHDGTWVAHPALVPVAMEVFDKHMPACNQVLSQRSFPPIRREDLLKPHTGDITEAGIRTNVSVGIEYTAAWLNGRGAVPIHNLMEDAATAEISRSQIWQWLHHKADVVAADGAARTFSQDWFRDILAEELAAIREAIGTEAYEQGRYELAAKIFTDTATGEDLPDFLTLPAYEALRQFD